jgi:hypothetical protein
MIYLQINAVSTYITMRFIFKKGVLGVDGQDKYQSNVFITKSDNYCYFLPVLNHVRVVREY